MKAKKKYTYFSPSGQSKSFATLEAMREFAKDSAHDGDYYIGVPSTQRSYHRNRVNMLKTFSDKSDT